MSDNKLPVHWMRVRPGVEETAASPKRYRSIVNIQTAEREQIFMGDWVDNEEEALTTARRVAADLRANHGMTDTPAFMKARLEN